MFLIHFDVVREKFGARREPTPYSCALVESPGGEYSDLSADDVGGGGDGGAPGDGLLIHFLFRAVYEVLVFDGVELCLMQRFGSYALGVIFQRDSRVIRRVVYGAAWNALLKIAWVSFLIPGCGLLRRQNSPALRLVHCLARLLTDGRF